MNKNITSEVNRIYKQKNPSTYFRNPNVINKFYIRGLVGNMGGTGSDSCNKKFSQMKESIYFYL